MFKTSDSCRLTGCFDDPTRPPPQPEETFTDAGLVPTCFTGRFGREVGCKLLEDVGHLLLHEKADEVGGCVELQRQRAGKPAPPLLDGGLEGLAQSLHFVVGTLFWKEER